MSKKKFFTHVRDGQLGPKTERELSDHLANLEGKRIFIEVGVVRKTRSLSQNAYYFGVIVQILRQSILETWGEEIDSDEAHGILKQNCNFKELINEQTGEIFKMPQTTTEMTMVQAEEYYERCRKWIFNYFNIVVPMPNEQSKIDLYL